MMRDDLLAYFERELTFLRQQGAEFAGKYPKVASRLLLEPDKCEDPHVERMIEAFAFLAGRLHLKIDDEFPQITEAFFNVLYPHYLAPIPSMSIVQFLLDREQAQLTSGYAIERGSLLYSRPVHGTPCRFRTCYPVTLWPLEIVSAALESPDRMLGRTTRTESMLRLSLRCLNDVLLGDLKKGLDEKSGRIDCLRFYLNGEWQLTYPLYEMILNQAIRVELRSTPARRPGLRASGPIVLPPSCLRPVGFELDEGLLPYTARSFPGYRLLTEYFAFPDKFLFFEVTHLEEAARAGFGEEWELVIYLREGAQPRSSIDASAFQLGCTPIVNLFHKVAEPIQLTHQQNEYQVVPDVHRQMATEIYSVDSVASTHPSLQETRQYQPFYSFRHAYASDRERIFWYANRRPSQRKDDPGTEVYISLVDLGFDPQLPPVETLTVHTTCTNRDLPGKLPFGGREGDFEIEGGQGLSKVRCLRKPTNTLRPPLRRGAHWRLMSHLSLNHLSIVEGELSGSPEALQEILMLYDFMDSAATRKQIHGVRRLSSRRTVRQLGSLTGISLVRGVETTMEFDEEQYVGNGVFLFASVLERFLGLYASVNSFSQLVARTQQREGVLKQWPARAGVQIVL
ncbi:MAG: type VI secretion system baseplate subunit TssF [Acidobacteria bacterium]|nr:type VI secretion system baseplate subunit TssF [Acidobacteriota bacterium]MCI0718848.1 type VI secretion system baseplate subunit TssF [Acidobacteriota bacterium]